MSLVLVRELQLDSIAGVAAGASVARELLDLIGCGFGKGDDSNDDDNDAVDVGANIVVVGDDDNNDNNDDESG